LKNDSVDGKLNQEGADRMKEVAKKKAVKQPKPFTPGFTKEMVRQHAYRLYRDKLAEGPLTLQDWVLAEKDLLATQETEGVEA
jgi:hypothetical protein